MVGKTRIDYLSSNGFLLALNHLDRYEVDVSTWFSLTFVVLLTKEKLERKAMNISQFHIILNRICVWKIVTAWFCVCFENNCNYHKEFDGYAKSVRIL
jgi:hypothetical protein